MESSQLMRIAMPHREIDAGSCLNFSGSLRTVMGFGNSRNEYSSFRTLLLASMINSYVEGSSSLTGVSGQTVRNHLMNRDPGRLLEINRDLISTLSDTGLLKKPLIVALDWHDEMYYGSHGTEGVIGTRNRAGTNYAYEYATVSIVVKGLRFAVAIMPVPERSILNVIRGTVDIVRGLGVRMEMLLMDGGFFSAEAIRYLVSANIPFIMHAPKLEKACDFTEVDRLYTTRSHRRRKGEQATFRMVSVHGKERSGKNVLYVFATSTSLPPVSILRYFRKRWGIETGYRMVRKFLAKTTSRRYSIRLLYFYLAVLLYNFWVLLNLKSRVRVVADVLRVLITTVLATANPFSTNLSLENRASGGEF